MAHHLVNVNLRLYLLLNLAFLGACQPVGTKVERRGENVSMTFMKTYSGTYRSESDEWKLQLEIKGSVSLSLPMDSLCAIREKGRVIRVVERSAEDKSLDIYPKTTHFLEYYVHHFEAVPRDTKDNCAYLRNTTRQKRRLYFTPKGAESLEVHPDFNTSVLQLFFTWARPAILRRIQ